MQGNASSKACILTSIKDEHPYLREWIEYHLNLGISHIFIMEDEGSEPHDSIVEGFGDSVSIRGIKSILSDAEMGKARALKRMEGKNPQVMYFQRGLSRVSELGQYDWCFAIDVDEFITLSDGIGSLSETLSMYDGHDAVILQWKCFGANGLIERPDYSSKGVVDTYTAPLSGHVPTASLKSYTKTCYNMRTFRPDFVWYMHQPSGKCDFCRTDLSKDREREVFDVMYIRHYITKSWEEYLWKKRSRGYFDGRIRTLDAFFKMNPDMADKQDMLLGNAEDVYLVVMPYVQGFGQGNEIRLALNGWRRFCQSKYIFVVIGDFDDSLPREFPWVRFMRFPRKQCAPGQFRQHIDVQGKMERMMEIFGKRHSGLIWMADDYYAIKPFEIGELLTTHFHGMSFVGKESAPTSYWSHDKWKTRKLLDREGLPHVNYTTHFPCFLSFGRLKEIWGRFNMREESYVLEDVYFNFFPHEEPIIDNEIRYGVWGPSQIGEPLERAIANPKIKFLCNSFEGWSQELEDRIGCIIYGDKEIPYGEERSDSGLWSSGQEPEQGDCIPQP